MALIKCTECGKEFSDKAPACPNCGCPTIDMGTEQKMEIQTEMDAEMADDISSKEEVKETKPKSKKTKVMMVAIAVVIVIAGISYFVLTADSRNYQRAEELFETEKYEEAMGLYEELGDYEDSAQKVKECQYQLSVDGSFMRDLAKGLMARWDQSDKYEEEGLWGEDPDAYNTYCEIELEYVEKYNDQTFENEDLQKDALQYIEYLKKAKEATTQYTVNYTVFSETWSEVYADRTMLLHKFVEDYGLAVDEAHQKTLEDIMVDASAAEKNKKIQENVAKMCETFEIVSETDEWDYTTYKVKMKNTTDLTFEYFSVDINVLDKEDNIIFTGWAGQVDNWKPGKEATVEAWFDEDINVKKAKVEYVPHYQSGAYYE